MASNCSFLALLFFVFTGFSACAFISDDVFEYRGSTGRVLLQQRKSCPVNFEFLNYTVITSQCKGPNYSPKLCCGALKELACPYSGDLNDLTNDCASTMFSYINLYGKYPPGLFANVCREGKEGLECPAQAPSESKDPNGSQNLQTLSRLLMLTACFLPLLIKLL